MGSIVVPAPPVLEEVGVRNARSMGHFNIAFEGVVGRLVSVSARFGQVHSGLLSLKDKLSYLDRCRCLGLIVKVLIHRLQ